MKHVIWIFFTLLVFSVANAADYGTYGYKYWAPKVIRDYSKLVAQAAPSTTNPNCTSFYKKVLDKGVLDIRYALGYFDDSTGEARVVDGINYGLSPSLDIESFNAVRGALTTPCSDDGKQFCGFNEVGDPKSGKVMFTKFIELHGMPVMVRLTLTQASASVNFLDNKGSLAARQAYLTYQSEQNFFGGLKTADVVFYNGHSRNGGGPDFNPPILNSHNKTDYKGYYEVKRPGIKRMLASLAENPGQKPIVGMFSCFSRKHFLQNFLDLDSTQKLILSADTINYFDSLKASVGYLEGILRGSCGPELSNMAKQEPQVIQGFTDYNMN